VLLGADMHIGKLHLGMGRKDIAVGALVLFMILFTVDVSTRILAELRRRSALDPVAATEKAHA
jgi:hypothetical protein